MSTSFKISNNIDSINNRLDNLQSVITYNNTIENTGTLYLNQSNSSHTFHVLGNDFIPTAGFEFNIIAPPIETAIIGQQLSISLKLENTDENLLLILSDDFYFNQCGNPDNSLSLHTKNACLQFIFNGTKYVGGDYC